MEGSRQRQDRMHQLHCHQIFKSRLVIRDLLQNQCLTSVKHLQKPLMLLKSHQGIKNNLIMDWIHKTQNPLVATLIRNSPSQVSRTLIDRLKLKMMWLKERITNQFFSHRIRLIRSHMYNLKKIFLFLAAMMLLNMNKGLYKWRSKTRSNQVRDS